MKSFALPKEADYLLAALRSTEPPDLSCEAKFQSICNQRLEEAPGFPPKPSGLAFFAAVSS
jgi:hypothetical protein